MKKLFTCVLLLFCSYAQGQSIATRVATLKASIDTGITFKTPTNKVRAFVEGSLNKQTADLVKMVNDSGLSRGANTLETVLANGNSAVNIISLKSTLGSHQVVTQAIAGSLITKDTLGTTTMNISTSLNGSTQGIAYTTPGGFIKLVAPTISVSGQDTIQNDVGTLALTKNIRNATVEVLHSSGTGASITFYSTGGSGTITGNAVSGYFLTNSGTWGTSDTAFSVTVPYAFVSGVAKMFLQPYTALAARAEPYVFAESLGVSTTTYYFKVANAAAGGFSLNWVYFIIN